MDRLLAYSGVDVGRHSALFHLRSELLFERPIFEKEAPPIFAFAQISALFISAI